jgi:hypothetical protein
MGLLEKYRDSKLLYHELIGPTKILLTRDTSNDQVSLRQIPLVSINRNLSYWIIRLLIVFLPILNGAKNARILQESLFPLTADVF